MKKKRRKRTRREDCQEGTSRREKRHNGMHLLLHRSSVLYGRFLLDGDGKRKIIEHKSEREDNRERERERKTMWAKKIVRFTKSYEKFREEVIKMNLVMESRKRERERERGERVKDGGRKRWRGKRICTRMQMVKSNKKCCVVIQTINPLPFLSFSGLSLPHPSFLSSFSTFSLSLSLSCLNLSLLSTFLLTFLSSPSLGLN